MTDFKWRHFQGDVILWAVRWYCRYPISYRDLEEMLAERGISVDHTTIYRWVQCYAPEMEKRLRWFWRRGFDPSWRLDETYVKVRGKWTYLYRAVDKRGDTIDFYLSPTRSRKAQDTDQAGARFQIDPHGLCHDQGIRSHASPAQRTGSPLVPAARHQGRGAPCGESFWHWALGADGGHGHAQPPFRSSRLIGAERQPTSDCRQSLQQSLRRHAHLALVHTSIEHSRGARRIRKKSYAKVFRASVRAETSRLPVCGSAARRNRRLG